MITHEALERATLAAWPAEHRLTRFGWEFCASGGNSSNRPNSVWPLAWDASVPLATAIAEAEQWCAAHGIRPKFKLADGVIFPPELPHALSAAAYAPHDPTLVMTRTIGVAAFFSGVALHQRPVEAFWRPLRDSAPSEIDFRERKAIVERITSPRAFALADLDGAPAAIGLGVLTARRSGSFSCARRRKRAAKGLRATLYARCWIGARSLAHARRICRSRTSMRARLPSTSKKASRPSMLTVTGVAAEP